MAKTPKKAGKFVYLFGKKTDGNGGMKPLLGGKGANLAEMCRIGLPVPPGFTITTEVCKDVGGGATELPKWLWPEIDEALAAVEKAMGSKFGSAESPLLVSVRSGAAVSSAGTRARP